jgi:cysteine-rich repeat protein
MYEINVNTIQSFHSLIFCGVGAPGVYYGPIMTDVYLYFSSCNQCSGSYAPIEGYCTACNVGCHCDGWKKPWVISNNSCSTLCGDGLKRGEEQCDDNNTNSHAGCSSTCKI